jgi:hypothetical protein
MKATLEFNLIQDNEEFQNAIHGAYYRAALENIREMLRSKHKYGHNYESVGDALGEIYGYVCSEIADCHSRE